LGGSGRGLIDEGSGYLPEKIEETTKNNRISGVSVEIQTEHLPNTDLEIYLETRLLGGKIILKWILNSICRCDWINRWGLMVTTCTDNGDSVDFLKGRCLDQLSDDRGLK
jgi:hypothetical protein